MQVYVRSGARLCKIQLIAKLVALLLPQDKEVICDRLTSRSKRYGEVVKPSSLYNPYQGGPCSDKRMCWFIHAEDC